MSGSGGAAARPPGRAGSGRTESARPGPVRSGSARPGPGRAGSGGSGPDRDRRALLAGERGGAVKDPGGRLSVALVWPGDYRTGMSSLGFLWVHGYLSGRPDALSERFFQPGPDGRVRSLETGRPLSSFDLVAASMVLENDYWILPRILEGGGIAPLRADRGRGPLVAAGGVGVWSNPWPLMPFVDVVLAGEGEAGWPPMADLLAGPEFLAAGARGRLELIAGRVPGALVPGLWDQGIIEAPWRDVLAGAAPRSDPLVILPPAAPGGTGLPAIGLSGDGLSKAGPPRPLAAVRPAFLDHPFPPGLLPPVSPIVARGAEFSGTALVEIGRGCPWGCRFCLAGFLYRPHRPWPMASILAALEPWSSPGARVGLISPAVADHPELPDLIRELRARSLSVGLSSMRLSGLTEELAADLAGCGLTGLAVAPEGGSAALRNRINKNLSESEILESARLLAHAGLRRLKLYFMIGLPGETDDDLRALADLATLIHRRTRVGRGGPKVAVSAANFTPKPHTPFETAPLLTEAALRRKGALLAGLVRGGGAPVELRLDPPRWSLVQGLLARGGPESAALTMALARRGGKAGPALRDYGYAGDHPLHLGEAPDRPWSIVAPRAGAAVLEAERRLADSGELSGPCPPGLGCGRCRACGPRT